MDIEPLLVRVAYGTHEQHVGWDGPAVPRGTRAARRWPLVDEMTYFYGANWAWEVSSLLLAADGDCVDDLFDEIRRVVDEHNARVRARDEG
jgi:hypothetical protein